MISRTWLTFVIGKYRTSDLTIRLLMEYCGTRSHFSTRNPFHPLPLTLFVPLLELVAGTARYFPSFLRGNFCSFTIQPDCRLLLVIRYIPGTITRKSLVKSDRGRFERKFLDFLLFFFFVVVVDERSIWNRGLNIGKFDWKEREKVILRCLISR